MLTGLLLTLLFPAALGAPHVLSVRQPPALPLLRIGSRLDGGYLVPAALLTQGEALEVVCGGVDTNTDFEQQLLPLLPAASRFHLIDPTLARPPRLAATHPESVRFYDEYVGRAGGWRASERLPQPERPVLLKLDIEGDEFAYLADDWPWIARHVRVLLLELHCWHATAPADVRALLDERVLPLFTILHAHANTYTSGSGARVRVDGIDVPLVFELTLASRRWVEETTAAATVTWPYGPIHALDAPNDVAHWGKFGYVHGMY